MYICRIVEKEDPWVYKLTEASFKDLEGRELKGWRCDPERAPGVRCGIGNTASDAVMHARQATQVKLHPMAAVQR
jgi:hypothetical protein